jgi:hypothetical protein
VSNPESPEIRIGNQEREEAITALGEHFSAGRLDVDEYGERTAKVTAARTRGELRDLFSDLPAPHPGLSTPTTPVTPSAEPATSSPAPVPRRSPARYASAAVSLSWLGAIIVMSTVHAWPVVFLPIALSIVFGTIWGKDWKHADRELRDQRRRQRRERRRYYD